MCTDSIGGHDTEHTYQLGARVRELRKEMGWSQEQLGEKADRHPTYVASIERGERNVLLENLEKLASAFKLSLAELFDFLKQKAGRRAQGTRVPLQIRRRGGGKCQDRFDYSGEVGAGCRCHLPELDLLQTRHCDELAIQIEGQVLS